MAGNQVVTVLENMDSTKRTQQNTSPFCEAFCVLAQRKLNRYHQGA
jgi:hypothetical protein